MSRYAPIALFVYARLDHTRRTVESLQCNTLASQSDLIIFSDGANRPEAEAQVQAVRGYIRTVEGFRSVTVVERERNFGLAASITDGVTRLCRDCGRVIVLEDDLVTAPHFLAFMNDGLNFYTGNERVIAICGYMYPVGVPLPESFFIRDPGCWGWATWQRAWNLFDFDGAGHLAAIKRRQCQKEFNFDGSYDYLRMLEDRVAGRNQSWAILWYATAFLRDKLTLYPGNSLVQNIGLDGSGTHGGEVSDFTTVLGDRPITVAVIPVEEDRRVRAALATYLRGLYPPRSLASRIRSRLARLLKV